MFQMKDVTFSFPECPEVLISPPLGLVKVFLNGDPTSQHMDSFLQLGVMYGHDEDTHLSNIRVIIENFIASLPYIYIFT